MGSPLYTHLLMTAVEDVLAGGPLAELLLPRVRPGRGDAAVHAAAGRARGDAPVAWLRMEPATQLSQSDQSVARVRVAQRSHPPPAPATSASTPGRTPVSSRPRTVSREYAPGPVVASAHATTMR